MTREHRGSVARMRTLARFTMLAALAIGMTGCLGPKEMPSSNMTSPHAKWIADVTPILGTWQGSIENEHAWVDGFRTEEALIVVAARARVPGQTVHVSQQEGATLLGSQGDVDPQAARRAFTARIARLEQVAPGTAVHEVGVCSVHGGAVNVDVVVFGGEPDRDASRKFVGTVVVDPARLPTRATTRSALSRPE